MAVEADPVGDLVDGQFVLFEHLSGVVQAHETVEERFNPTNLAT
jgi:hypothetical protein